MRNKNMLSLVFLLATMIGLSLLSANSLSASTPVLGKAFERGQANGGIVPLEVYSQNGLIEMLDLPESSFWESPDLIFAAPPDFEVVKLVNNGPDSENIVITIMGDGFTASQQDYFLESAQTISNYLLDFHPFSAFKDKFNVYAIKVISNVSGVANKPSELIDNYFGSTFYYDGVTQRLLYTTYSSKVYQVLNSHTPKYDMPVVIANSTVYGGAGGSFAVTSLEASAKEILVHELGHSAGGLLDEYWWTGREGPNMTQDNNPTTNKWRHWLGFESVGIYPYAESPTWFRPHQNCEMRYLNRAFCEVCATELTKRMAAIAQEPFYGRSDLTNAIIGDGTTSIGDYTYYGCEDLITVSIPATVIRIGRYAFLRCDSLTSVTNSATIPQPINETTFAGVQRSNITLSVPQGTIAAYLAAGWTGFREIKELAATFRVSGRVKSYDPKHITNIQLMQDGEEICQTTIAGINGYEQLEQDFAFVGVAPGIYSLVIKKDFHTNFTVQNLVVKDKDLDLTLDSRPEVQLMTLRCGDINGDGLVNDADLTVLWRSGNYNKRAGEAENSWCDLNGDDLINDADLTILWLAYNYNRGQIIIE